MAVVSRQMTATLAGQVATFAPKAGTHTSPDQLAISAATITFTANASTIINTLDDYEITLVQKTRT